MSVRHGVVRLVPASLRGWVSYHTPDHFVSPLAVARTRQSIVKGIDPNHGRQLRSITGPVRMTSRDFNMRLHVAILRAMYLGLHRSRGLSILDVGCAGGFFIAVARHLQHTCVGSDMPPEKLDFATAMAYETCLRAFGCIEARRSLEVRPYTSLALDGTFDLITAGLICFNEYQSGGIWSRPEWEFFLADIVQYLRPGGRLYLEFNEHRHCGALRWYDRETQEFFAGSGVLNRNKFVYVRKNASSRVSSSFAR